MDKATLGQLVTAGADLSRPLAVDHFVEDLDERSAESLAEELERRGYSTTLHPPSEGSGWGVQATHRTRLDEEAISHLRDELTKLAEEHGGDYDGWGAQIN